MDVKIKLNVEFSLSDSAMEEAMAEYDELTVEGLIREIIDKAIACDEITTKVEDGPNTLEELDQIGPVLAAGLPAGPRAARLRRRLRSPRTGRAASAPRAHAAPDDAAVRSPALAGAPDPAGRCLRRARTPAAPGRRRGSADRG